MIPLPIMINISADATQATYEIRLAEPVDLSWREHFAGWDVVAHPVGGTLIRSSAFPSGSLPTLLRRVEDLGLTLLALRRVEPHEQAVTLGGTGIGPEMSDIEQRADVRTRELATLLEVSRQVASTLDLMPLLQVILTQVRDVLDYAAAGICLAEGPDVLRPMIYNGPLPPGQALPRWHIGPARPHGTPLEELIAEAESAHPHAHFREVFYSGKPVIIPDVQADTLLARVYRARVRCILGGFLLPNIRTWMGVPLIYRDEVIGVLGFDHEQPEAYIDHHARIALAVANQAAIAIANARLLAEVQGHAAQEERQRLARDLHDAVTQQLFSASLIGEVLPQIWAANAVQGQEYLEDLRLLTRGALAEMRALLVELRPAALTDTSLPELLQHLTSALGGRARMEVDLQVVGEQRLTGDVQVALYRVAQEALNNIAKHAKARHAWIVLQLVPGEAVLEMRDDGRGFDPEAVSAGHFGLAIMRERMAAVGGTVEVESRPGRGTTLVVRCRTA